MKWKKKVAVVLCICIFLTIGCFFLHPFSPREPQHRQINQKEVIPIFFNVDNNYVKYMAATMASILENTNSPIHFYVVHSGISEENKAKIERMKEAYGFDVDFISFSPFKYTFRSVQQHVTKETMMRLYVADYAPQELDKIIFLDADLIVLADIADLYETDIRDYNVATVSDQPPFFEYIPLPAEHHYVNTGVMLINLKKWRQNNATQRFEEVFRQYFLQLKYPDQDVINLTFVDSIKYLPMAWNIQMNYMFASQVTAQMVSEVHIAHYAGKRKPWNTFLCPHSDWFWHYAEATPFYAEIWKEYWGLCLIFILKSWHLF